MTKPKTPRPVESFGPELFATLIKAATSRVELKMPYRNATRFRMRIHQLRESMRKSGHEHYELCSRVRVTIRWPTGAETEKIGGRHQVPVNRSIVCQVVLQPNDAEFASVLREQAGIDPLAHSEGDSVFALDSEGIDRLLDDLK